MKKLYTIYYLIVTAILSVIVLNSCSDDSSLPDGEVRQLHLIPYANYYTDVTNGENTTRALPTDYQIYPSADATIAVYLAKENTVKYEGAFTRIANANTWSSNVMMTSNSQYYVFGYMPASSANNVSITSSDYAQGAQMTLTGLKTIVPTDVCVIVGVAKGTGPQQSINDSGVKPGSYAYTSSADEADNYLFLLLDHLYSRVDLEYAVDATYNELRTIKLKDVKMRTQSGPGTVDVTANLTTDSDKPLTVDFSNSSGTTGVTSDPLLMSATDLMTDYLSVPGYFTPGASLSSFDVISSFDVYDKKGHLLRENCQATNKISIPSATNGAGKSYTVRLNVQPTYLYQLSEPDLDNPTIKSN